MPPIEAKRHHGQRDGPPIAAIYGDTRVRNWAQQESDADPAQCPLWIQKRTNAGTAGLSALCQSRHFALRKNSEPLRGRITSKSVTDLQSEV